jgi:hypothetical protein
VLSRRAVLYLKQHTRRLRGEKRGKGSRSATGAKPIGSGGGEVDLPSAFGSRSPAQKCQEQIAPVGIFAICSPSRQRRLLSALDAGAVRKAEKARESTLSGTRRSGQLYDCPGLRWRKMAYSR